MLIARWSLRLGLAALFFALAAYGLSLPIAAAEQNPSVDQAAEASLPQTDLADDGEHPVYHLRPEPFSDAGKLTIDLDGLLELAVANNFGIRQQHYTIERSHFAVDQTYYAFDPSVSSSLNYSRRAFGTSAATTGSGVSSSESYSWRSSFSQPREFGDGYSIDFDLGRSSFNLLGGGAGGTTIPTTYDAAVTLAYSRPLARGAGKYVNRIPRYIASNSAQLAYDQLDDQVRKLKNSVIDLYFQAVAARESIAVREAGLDVALKQLERAVERYKVGLSIKVDVLQAENSVLSQRSELLNTITALDGLLDQLTTLTGISVSYQLAVDADGALVDLGSELPAELWEMVRESSYDLKSLNTQLANLRLTRDQQLNRMKPDIGLSLSYGRSGEDDSISSAITSYENENINIGLMWSVTPGERNSKAELAKTELDLASLELSIQDLELQLKAALRALQRDLMNRRQQIDMAEGNLEVLRETHLITLERNHVGLATTLEVVEAQEAVLAGELALLNAEVSYHEAYRELLLLAGLI